VPATALEAARDAYADFRWDVAYDRFRDAAAEAELETRDLAALADAAWWLGETDESLALSEQVYRRCLQDDEVGLAARLAIEVGFLWMLRGEPTIGSGWVSRASRLLDGVPECAAHGYLLHLEVLEALGSGRFEAAVGGARRMQGLAQRCDDPSLEAVGLALEGVATVKRGAVAGGLGLLDESMLAVRAGVVTPNWAGNLYCHLMGLFLELADLPRARAWTSATERWCDQHSHAAMFAGICRVHRAQLLQLEGAWADAERRAVQACRDLADMNVGAVAAAHYELGELHRVRGDHPGADAAYARARELGRDPQPGLARLRLSQGRTEVAATALRAALAGSDQPLARAPLLAAQVDVAEVVGDVAGAEEAAAELHRIAATFATSGLGAMAQQAAGTARLVAGQPEAALAPLRDAHRQWREVGVAYQAARTQMRLGWALTAVGDRDGGARELAAARAALAQLGAQDDLDRLAGAAPSRDVPGGLSSRELEVLRLVAAGGSNRAVAEELTISVRTVERHVANIFTKLGVSSRTEAAGVAFSHGLVVDRP
jgi:DNA-binding CsgD family transcriptional regulator